MTKVNRIEPFTLLALSFLQLLSVPGNLFMLHVGKYDKDTLPAGPRAGLFRQILPGAQPLLDTLQEVATNRRKTIPQVRLAKTAKHRTLCN